MPLCLRLKQFVQNTDGSLLLVVVDFGDSVQWKKQKLLFFPHLSSFIISFSKHSVRAMEIRLSFN